MARIGSRTSGGGGSGGSSSALALLDLTDRFDDTTETVPTGATTNCAAAGVTKTAPALDSVLPTVPKRFAVRNSSTGTITVSYPSQTGSATNLTILAGEVLTFRQKTTLGWAAESGNKTLSSLDGRFLLATTKGAASGVASLDGSGQVPLSQLGNAPAGSGGGFSSSLTQIRTTAVTSQPATGQPVATLNAVTGLAAGWIVFLGADVVTAERKIVASVSGNDVTFTTNITGTHPTTELVAYANNDLTSDYMTLATRQQVTGPKIFTQTLASTAGPAYAAPGSSVGYALDIVGGMRSRANGGGGIVVVPRAETKPVIDWISDGTNSGAYLFHLTQSLPAGTTNPGLNGASSATIMGIGVQGGGGSGILIAKDGPTGYGLFVDQKTVVTNATAAAISGLHSSHFAPFLAIPVGEPTTTPAISLSSGALKTIPGMRLLLWQPSGQIGTSYIDGQTGWINAQYPIVADNSPNNVNAGLWFKGRGSAAWNNAAFLDEIGPNPAGAAVGSESALRFATAAGSAQHYLGSMRLSKTTFGLHIAVHSGSARIGTDVPESLADFAPGTGARLGFGHDVAVTNLAVPTGLALSGAGATGGSTTYGYRVAAVNAKGTTIACTTVSTAVGNATLDGTNKIILTWAASLGASSYKVYGRTSGSELLMATVTVPSRTLTDGVMQTAATRTVTDAVTVGVGNSTVTSATAAFTAADVGAKIYLTAGGGLGPGYNGYETYGQVTAVNSATSITVSSVIGVIGTGYSLTISNPAMNRITSATAAFTAADVGKGINAPVGTSGATVYGFITTYESATSVLVSFTATTAMTAGTFTITGGNVPLTFTDDGTVTPAGALPGTPVGTKLSVTRWQSQTGDVFDLFDETGAKLFSFDKNGHPVAGGTAATIGAGTATVVASNAAGAQGAFDAAGGVTATAAAVTPIAGVVANITFGGSYVATPKGITLTATSAAAVAAGLYVSSKASSTFVVSCANAPAAGAVLTFDYHVVG